MRYLSVTGKTWNIPKNAEKPGRTNKRKEAPITLMDILDLHVKFERIHPFHHKRQLSVRAATTR